MPTADDLIYKLLDSIREQLAMDMSTSLPPTKTGTSTAPCFLCLSIASWSFLRSAEPLA